MDKVDFSGPIQTGESVAERLNQNCFCLTLDRDALCRAFVKEVGDARFCAEFIQDRPNLFSNTPVFVPRPAIQKMRDVVKAIEEAASMPAYKHDVLLHAAEIAPRRSRTTRGSDGL